jgi:hypothetical protein
MQTSVYYRRLLESVQPLSPEFQSQEEETEEPIEEADVKKRIEALKLKRRIGARAALPATVKRHLEKKKEREERRAEVLKKASGDK